MNEPNDSWSEMLKNAVESARAGGRHDVADYLELKAANDAVRHAGAKWLVETLIAIAMERENERLGLEIDRTDGHVFTHLGASLTGTRLNIRRGVRCLSLEAGWTRGPADGFMRGGAMAVAKITHFGMPRQNAVLHLITTEDLPVWKVADAESDANAFTIDDLQRHFRVFID